MQDGIRIFSFSEEVDYSVYSTTLTLDTCYSNTIIDSGPIYHTIRVYIKVIEILSFDVTWARADISAFLIAGTNRAEVVDSTLFGSTLRFFW